MNKKLAVFLMLTAFGLAHVAPVAAQTSPNPPAQTSPKKSTNPKKTTNAKKKTPKKSAKPAAAKPKTSSSAASKAVG